MLRCSLAALSKKTAYSSSKASALRVVCVSNGREIDSCGMFLLAQVRAHQPLRVHTAHCCLPFSSRSTAEKKKWLQYKKPHSQAPGTPFSNLSAEVRLEERHRNCCRFGRLKEVHQGAHICRAKLGINEKFRSS